MSAPPPEAWWVRPLASTVDPPPDVDRHGPTLVLAAGTRPGRVPDGTPDAPGRGPDHERAGAPAAARTRRQLRRVRQTRAPRRWRRWLAAAGATGAAVATLVAVLLPPAPPAPRPAAAAVRVDPAGITASASSTSRPDGAVTYVAENTLDGDPSTAWNSAGGLHPGSGGIALTYTFGHPVDLRSIVVLNGYQKVRRRSGHSPVDLYPANARVRWVRIVTDAGRWTWELADRRAPQSFTAATGRTGSVRLDVMSTYPSTTYPDIALSEVSFTAALSG